MANTRPALQAQITITEDVNDGLSVYNVGGAAETELVVAPDTYDDIHALITQVQAELNTHAVFATWTVSVSDEGIVTIAANATFKILWKTGTNHGSDNDDDHIGTLLGFDDSADDDNGGSGALTYSADYQHMYGWYPDRYPVQMGPWNPQAVGSEIIHNVAGTYSKKLHTAFHHTYDVIFAALAPERVFSEDATTTDSNKDLEHVWEELSRGDFGTWYTDASDTSSGTKCYLLAPHDWDGAVTRPYTDYRVYDLTLTLGKQES